ncbi:MAG: family 16 glycosylhydrolase [Prevotella sp.]|nr:family 16 glycosylhydrolase [Prevotella sp.]
MKLLLSTLLLLAATTLTACGGDDADDNGGGGGTTAATLTSTPAQLNVQAEGGTYQLQIHTTGTSWAAYPEESAKAWLSITTQNAQHSEGSISVSVAANTRSAQRTGHIVVQSAGQRLDVVVTQEAFITEEPAEVTAESGYVPAGYTKVWADEFNQGDQLNSSDWEWETNWGPGMATQVNDEEQYYIKGARNGINTTEQVNGRLVINCFKASDGKIYSGRVNAKNGGKGWQYGYFEARILLPKGKGTWPAFWMMPISVDWVSEGWPKCGEIDIMEEVGVDANVVSSSLHAEGHYHVNNTQVTVARNIGTAESEYHIYALEWTTDYIKTYVDGQLLLSYSSDHTVRNFPYDKPFHLILNLAWGGSWGGYAGTDESALPVQMKVDYVRVYQKN